MLSPRADLGIAQAVFYAPIVPCALYLLLHRRQSPKFVWYLMTMFSLSKFQSDHVLSGCAWRQSLGGMGTTKIHVLTLISPSPSCWWSG